MRSGSLVGMEVPITGTDQLKWIELSIPSSSPPQQPYYAPLTEDSSSCHVMGDPPSYLIWRIHKSSPNAIELFELTGSNEVPTTGLRLDFCDALSPFAFICQDQVSSNVRKATYLLYTMSVSGVAYVIKLGSVSDYASSSVLSQNEFIEFNLQTYSQSAPITAVTATRGGLVVGRCDGSVACFQLSLLDASVQGFMHELRDDVGIGRLWGLVSRGKNVGPVQDLVISECLGRKMLFAIQEDGCLRVWDLFTQSRILSHSISSEELAGCRVSRLWVADINQDECLISLAILYNMEVDMEKIAICSLHVNPGDKVSLMPAKLLQYICLEEGGCVDLKVTSNKLLLLKEDGLLLYEFMNDHYNLDEANSYHLQEVFVADQLFQSSEHSFDDLSWTSLSLSSVKDRVVPFVSSILLRRLLHPGIYQSAALRKTANDYGKYWSDSEFQSLTINGLKKQIFSLVEGEDRLPLSIINRWKTFYSHYFHYWCESNRPYGLLIDSSTGAVGLIRKHSVSLFRCLEDIELLIYGSFDEFGDSIKPALDLESNVLDREILFEVLRCISSISQQLGKAAAAIFYESLISAQTVSSEEIVPGFLKILETGYSLSVVKLHVSQFGADVAWKKKLEDHKNQRKFSVDMILSLHGLLRKAASWAKVLDIIEKYIKFLVPLKSAQNRDAEAHLSVNSSMLILSTSQVARVMFESAFDVLLLLGYLVNASGQVHITNDDKSRIQTELIPMIQELLMEWIVLHFLGTTPSESPALEDFSTRLSSLHIDGNIIRRSWSDRLGTCDFTVASLLFLNSKNSSEDLAYISSCAFPSPNSIICSVQNFTSWIVWGSTGEESYYFLSRSIELGTILLRHGQYEAVENLFGIVYAHSCNEKTSESVQMGSGEWCTHLHLLGFCLLARAQRDSQGVSKEMKIREAVRCFFRASSGEGAQEALQSLSFQGLPHLGYFSRGSDAAWKLHYYQWAMQIFEQYNCSEGACQFALASLEQVDEILGSKDDKYDEDPLNEPATSVRGRLWANVFKFTLDLNYYYDAYCAIISNPDEESKHICLRRFVIVLCEHGLHKTLCDGQLPFVGLTEKVEEELARKAERSDVAAKMNPYKLLYAFETQRHNWRRAASYMYRYASRLRSELSLIEHKHCSVALQERLNGLSSAINALNLVDPDYAWIDPQLDSFSCLDEPYHNKTRKLVANSSPTKANVQCWKKQYCVDIEKLEKEYVQTSAEHVLSLANVNLKFKENLMDRSHLVGLLVQTNLYDMAFTLLLKFWKDSGLKREMEQVFVSIALKCCPNRASNFGNDIRTDGLLLTLSEDESCAAVEANPSFQLSNRNSPWEILELYLEKYKKLDPRLPVIVAETLLHADPQTELPLWLVHMFKGGRRATSWGMTGFEADPASLFRLYVTYGRYTEATNLLLEYIDSFAALRPADIIHRKKMSAIWFPYTTVERLWCQLEETSSSGYMVEQFDKLKRILQGALISHLNLIKVDSHDAVSSATC